MIEYHINKFPDHSFNLEKYLSDDDFFIIVLELFWSESFEEFMKTPDEAVDDWWKFLIGIWGLEYVQSVFKEFHDSHIKSINIGFGVIRNPEIKRWLLKGDIKLFVSNFLSDIFELDGSKFGRKCVTFDQRETERKVSFKILQVLGEALNGLGLAFLVIH